MNRYEQNERPLNVGLISQTATACGAIPEQLVLACLQYTQPSVKNTEIGKSLQKVVKAIEAVADD